MWRNRLSVLDSPKVVEESERQKQESQLIQTSSHFHRRVRWAKSDRQKLEDTLVKLRRGNNDLESLLQLKTAEEPCYLCQLTTKTEPFFIEANKVRDSLGRLHLALMRLNVKTDDHAPYQLSLQLREDPKANGRDLAQEPNVNVREDSLVFNIQKQESTDYQDKASLLLVDTAAIDSVRRSRTKDHVMGKIHDLRCSAQADQGQSDPVQALGYLESNDSWHSMLVYHDTSGQWVSPHSLCDIIADGTYRANITPTQIAQIARLVLVSHIHFTSVRQYLAIDPRPAHY